MLMWYANEKEKFIHLCLWNVLDTKRFMVYKFQGSDYQNLYLLVSNVFNSSFEIQLSFPYL